MKKILLLAVLLLALAAPCFGATLTFTWTANTETDLAGYNLYKNAQYVKTIEKTETTCTDEITEDGFYIYYLTAFDFSANESEKSTPVYYKQGTAVSNDTTPPTKVNFSFTVQ